ncbi:MAG TPA: hypothetical protein DD791_05575 [Syntrophomonas sp.]|jgi:hypothetical protein|nr:hypothetical protein [Syntrophomonas sp.]
MYSIPWYIAIFESIPETFLIIFLGTALFNIFILRIKIFHASVLSAGASFFIRLLPLPFGIHTFIGLIVISCLVWLFGELSWWVAFICTLAGMVCLLVLQSLMIPVMLPVLGLEYSELAKQPWLNVFLFIPQGLLMAVAVLFVKSKKVYLYDLHEKA